jgi:hypothetical protein
MENEVKWKRQYAKLRSMREKAKEEKEEKEFKNRILLDPISEEFRRLQTQLFKKMGIELRWFEPGKLPIKPPSPKVVK